MLLAVAGANQAEVDQRTRQITTGNWKSFAPAEQLAFAFAYALTTNADRLHRDDVRGLCATFGSARAVGIIWFVAWCNYMTRVADALQLPLETSNVFLKR